MPLSSLLSCFLSLVFFFALLPFPARADDSLMHNVGSVEMLVSDWGALSEIEEGSVYANFGYSGNAYMDPFSGIWAGIPLGHVASAYDGIEGNIVLGEWQATEPSGQPDYVPGRPYDSQGIHAQYAAGRYPGFPLSIIVDQYTYAWDSTVYPDDDDYVVMKLVLTNGGGIQLEDFFLAVQTNWDVDISEGMDDLVAWDAERRAGIVYDSDGTDPVHTALSLLSGKLASHNIVDLSTWSYEDLDRAAIMSNGEIDDPREMGMVPSNYFNVISAGPYTIPPGESVSVVYAFAAGEGLQQLLGNLDSARRRVIAPEKLAAEPSNEAVHLTWSQGISPDAAAYNVYRSTTSGSGYAQLASVPPGSMAYTDTQMAVGNIYYYVITAVGRDDDETAYSNEVSASPGIPPPPPRNLTARSDAFADPVVHWDPPIDDETTGYVVFRNSTGSEPWTAIATLKSSVRSFVDQNVYDENTYYYTVATTNIYNWTSEYSNVVSVTIDLPKPLGAAVDLSAVVVAPNPCRLSSGEKLRFIHLTARADINVYTSVGELVKVLHHTDGGGEEEWNLRNDRGMMLASGIYVYYVESYKTEETGKFTASGKFALTR